MSSTQEAGEIFGEGRGPAHAMLRSPTVLIASVGLWGMNIFFFRLFKINYVKVLKHDLLKLEEMEFNEHNHHHHQHEHPPPHHLKDSFREDEDESSCFNLENASSENFSRSPLPQTNSSSSKAKARSSSPTQLIQRTPSNGVPLVAAATTAPAGNSGTPTGSPNSGGTADHEDHHSNDEELADHEDDGQLQLVGGSSGESDHVATAGEHAAITANKLVGLSALLLVLLHSTYFWWLDILEGGTIGAVLMFYTLVVLGIAIPFRCTRWLRKATVITLQRTYELINPRCHCVTNDGLTPPRFIPFVDVFYADAMCSLSKVFFDWGMLLHMVSHYPDPVPAAAHNILIPSLCAAVPYLIRARQCLIMYTVGRIQKESNRFSHLWNALKYSTSIFPLCLSAYQQTVSKNAAHKLEGLLITLMVINSVYSLYWDIVMDWGMFQENWIGVALCNTGASKKMMMMGKTVSNPHKAAQPLNCAHTVLRPRLRFGFAMSALIFSLDCVLRFSWTLRFAKTALFPNADAFVLCTQFLEVFRRALWNLLRVEWENIKHSKHKAMSPVNSQSAENNSTLMVSSASAAGEVELKSLLPSSGKLNRL